MIAWFTRLMGQVIDDPRLIGSLLVFVISIGGNIFQYFDDQAKRTQTAAQIAQIELQNENLRQQNDNLTKNNENLNKKIKFEGEVTEARESALAELKRLYQRTPEIDQQLKEFRGGLLARQQRLDILRNQGNNRAVADAENDIKVVQFQITQLTEEASLVRQRVPQLETIVFK